MKKILIIEDDALIARIYSTKYAASGFMTRIAGDGEEGLALLKEFQPDLVHLDLHVPKINGVAIIGHIRAQEALKGLPILVLTNSYQNRLVKAALDAGANECVSKATCTPKTMVDLVEKLLGPAPRETSPTVSAPSSSSGGGLSPAPNPAAAPLTSPPDASDITYTQETSRHFDFHDEIRKDFLTRAPRLLADLRARIQPLLRAPNEARRLREVSSMCSLVRSLGGHAGLAGFQELSQMAGALEALFLEAADSPAAITTSCIQTIIDACELLSSLLDRSATTRPDFAPTGVVLAVDADDESRRSLCEGLRRLGIATIGVATAQEALTLSEENHFSLIFTEAELPGMGGFELCEKLRTLPANRATPVIFLTPLADFARRERSLMSGGNDVIAKPFFPMEVAVKALTLFRREPNAPRLTVGQRRSWPRRLHAPKQSGAATEAVVH